MKRIACSEVRSRQSVISIICLAALKYLNLHIAVSHISIQEASHNELQRMRGAKLVSLVDKVFFFCSKSDSPQIHLDYPQFPDTDERDKEERGQTATEKFQV